MDAARLAAHERGGVWIKRKDTDHTDSRFILSLLLYTLCPFGNCYARVYLDPVAHFQVALQFPLSVKAVV